jgi:hypothetical protein
MQMRDGAAESPSLMEASQLLSEFVRGGSVAERVALLRQLVVDKSIHSIGEETGFETGLVQLVDNALDPHATSEERFKVAAALGRLQAVSKSKSLKQVLRREIQRLLVPPLVSSGAEDGDDRYYVVVCCGLSDASWIPSYLATVAVHEESHEGARREAVAALTRKLATIQDVLSLLAEEAQRWSPDTGAPSESAARRARRLLAAIGEVLATHEGEPGMEPGRALGVLLRAFGRKGEPLRAKVLHELATQVFSVVHMLVRSRFSLATEPATYDAIRMIRGWFPHGSWARWLGDEADRASAIKAVTRDVTEAIAMLAKQGTCDDALFEQLALVCGSREEARAKARELAANLRGLAPDVQAWLMTGERGVPATMQGSALARESQEIAENMEIARLMRDIHRLSALGAFFREQFLPELQIIAPQSVRSIDGLLAQGRLVAQGCERLAERRGLQLRGKAGDIEEYSPLEHELPEGMARSGVRWVRLLEPIVQRMQENGVAIVVEKGLVEPAPPPATLEGNGE